MADNPYAAYATPSADNPYAAYDPAGAFKTSMAAGPIQIPDTSTLQNVKVAARAASPYATAAGVGALAGAPFGGPVGSAAGAGLATLGLAAGDVGTTGYNALARYLGMNRVSTPSEVIQNAYGKVGIGAPPQTSNQALLDAIVSGAAGAGGQAGAFRTLAGGVQSPVTQRVMTELGRQPVIQMGAGAGGAAAPAAAQEYGGVSDPYTLAASSLAGAILGGKMTASAGNIGRGIADTARAANTPTNADLRTQAQRSYRAADDAGVVYRPAAFDDFATNLEQRMAREGFDARLYPNAEIAMDRIRTATATDTPGVSRPQTFQDLDILRRVAGAARNSQDASERRLGLIITDQLNDFATRPPAGAVLAGDAPEAARAVRDARFNWSRMSKSGEIEDAVQRARLSPLAAEKGKLDEAIRTQFASLTREIDNGWHPGFTEAEVANIRRVAEGKSGSDILRMVSQLKPGTSLGGAVRTAAQLAAGTAAVGGPAGLALAIPTMAAGYGARVGRNALAELNAANLSAGMRRGDVALPFNTNAANIGLPAYQQFQNAFANQ